MQDLISFGYISTIEDYHHTINVVHVIKFSRAILLIEKLNIETCTGIVILSYQSVILAGCHYFRRLILFISLFLMCEL